MNQSNTPDSKDEALFRFLCKMCRVIHAAACPVERSTEQGTALLRVSKELRGWLSDAPPDDNDARSLLQDCDELERAAETLLTERTIVL